MKFNSVFYISAGMIKFLQVSGGPKKLVTAADVINTAKQSDTQISEALSAFIKAKKLNFGESRVTVLIPRARVILRHMVVPSQRPDEIRLMIDLQVSSNIPYAREDVEIDFQILSKTAEGYSKVAVVIVPQEIAMRYWKIFSDAKVPVHGMTISSVGLWLLYQQQPDLSDELGAILDLDIDQSEICLCSKTQWLTSREIPVGFMQMQQDGCAEFIKQWELTKTNAGGEKGVAAVRSVYLASSANRAYALGGEMAKAEDNLKIKEILLTQSLGLDRAAKWPKLMTEDGVSVAALAGVAFSSEHPPIDLVPRSVRQVQEQHVYQRQLIILGVWVMAALISLGLAFGMGFFKKNLQLVKLEDQLRDAKHDVYKVESQLKMINDIEAVLNGRLIFTDMTREVYRLLPAQAYLVSITISDGNTLSLQGIASNTLDVSQFQSGMVNSPIFSNVSLDYVNKRVTQQGEVDYFKITCTLKTVNGKK